MRNYDECFELRPSLIGTIGVISATAVGNPVDTIGFKDALAILIAGSLQGSTGATVSLAIKIQESASATGTGADWTDITDGAFHNGSWDFDTLTFGDELAGGTTTATWLPTETQKQYERLGDGVRKRYIRAHATLTGTVGLGPRYTVAFLLGRNYDSSNVVDAVVQPTGNIHYAKQL